MSPGTVRWAWFSWEELPRLLQRVAVLLPALASLASVCGFTVYYAVDIVLFALILGAFAGLLEGGLHWLRNREPGAGIRCGSPWSPGRGGS